MTPYEVARKVSWLELQLILHEVGRRDADAHLLHLRIASATVALPWDKKAGPVVEKIEEALLTVVNS